MPDGVDKLLTSGVFKIAHSDIPKHSDTITLDSNAVLDKASIMQALMSAFQFPEYFGDNWDAAYDCLLDWAMQRKEATDIYFSISENVQVIEQDFLTFTQMLQDVCDFQTRQQQTMRFFIASMQPFQ